MSSKSYISGIILSFFLSLGVFASVMCIIVQCVLFNGSGYTEIIKNHGVVDEAYENIQKDFKEYSHESGIEPKIFTDEISKEFVESAVYANVDTFAKAVKGESVKYEAANLDDMNDAVHDYLTDYANKNGYAIDDAFEQKVTEVTNYADNVVNRDVDVMKVSSLKDEGILDNLPRYITAFRVAAVAVYVYTLIFLVILTIVAIKNKSGFTYWYGCVLFVAGLIIFIPAVYDKATDYFANFSIKETGLYYTVTEIADKIVNISLTASIISMALGIILIAINMAKSYKRLTADK